MAIVTISREFGSEGLSIGQRVAKSMGYQFVDKDTIEAVLLQYGFIQFNELYNSTPGFWARINQTNLQLISMLNQTLLALAKHGRLVILGRGGFFTLRDYADVLNVRVQAPFPLRVQRMMVRENLTTLQQSEELVRETDKQRSAFFQGFFERRQDIATDFNLMIDTGTVPPDMAVNWIIEATKLLEQQTFDAAVATTQNIEVDPVLADAVSNVLKQQALS